LLPKPETKSWWQLDRRRLGAVRRTIHGMNFALSLRRGRVRTAAAMAWETVCELSVDDCIRNVIVYRLDALN
jgi:hypothetical protein